MSTPPNFLDFPWRWQMVAGRPVLVTEDGATIILSGQFSSRLQTCDMESLRLRDLDPSDDIAKIIAAAPDVRRHAQAFINGIDIGLVRINTDADRALANVLGQLREALEKSGGA